MPLAIPYRLSRLLDAKLLKLFQCEISAAVLGFAWEVDFANCFKWSATLGCPVSSFCLEASFFSVCFWLLMRSSVTSFNGAF
jgi:hypothetical protein